MRGQACTTRFLILLGCLSVAMIVVPIASAQIAAPTIQLGPTQQLQQGGSSVGGTIDSGLPGSPGHSFLGQFQHYLHPEIPAGVPAAKTGDCDISCLLEDVQDIDFGEDSIQSFRLKPDVRVPLHQFFTRYGAALGLRLGEGDSIKEARSFKDFLGYTHHRYKQYYNDLEVIAAEYNLVEKDGRVDYASTNGILGLNPPTAPFLTEPEALYLAEQAIGAASYPWKTDPTKYPVPPGTLAIGSKDFAMTKASARLVWRFDFSSHEVHIDAVTGETVNIEDNIIRFDYSEWGNLAKKESLPLNQNVPSKGTSYLYGEVNIMADLGLDGKYRLAHQQDGSVPAPLGTFDARPYHTQGGDPVIELFTDNDLEGMSPNNFLDPDDDVGISVHWGLERAMVFFASQFGWLGMDGKGEKAVKAFIIDDETKHKAWFQQGTNTVFFNVSPSKIAPTVLPPPVQLPTMGHEFTHGIFQEMTSGVYTGENCALNEGFAFYFGVVVLVFSDISPILDIDGDYFDYYVQDPKSGNKPTTYLGEFYQNSGGEDHCHVNATILTHWAYLLANGGTGTNDFGNEFNVVSIDPSATRGLVFLTMMNLSPTADFKEARQVSINVASFFLNPAAASSVMEAWHAVGVGDKTEAATIPVDGAKNVETWPAQLAYENQPKKTITKFQAASTYAFDSEPQVSLPSWSTTKDGKLMVGATFNLAQGEFFAPGKSYFWRVCFQKNKTDPSPLEKPAIKVGPPIVVAPDNSCDGDWSETHYFWGGKSVVLISPIKTPKQYHPPAVYPWDAVFQWVPVPNATAYDLYLGLEDEDDSGSSETIIADIPANQVVGSYIQVTRTLLVGRSYNWHVVANGPPGTEPLVSNVVPFETTLPLVELVAPADGSSGLYPWGIELISKITPGAKNYKFLLDESKELQNSDLSSLYYDAPSTPSNELPNVKINLTQKDASTSIEWSCWSKGPLVDGEPEEEVTVSEDWSFTVDYNLTKPKLYFPANKAKVTMNSSMPYKLSWVPVPEASAYVIQIYKNLGKNMFGNLVKEMTVNAKDLSVVNGVAISSIPAPSTDSEPSTPNVYEGYCWRVYAYPAAGQKYAGVPSETWCYDLGPDKPVPLYPLSSDSPIDYIVYFKWESQWAPFGYVRSLQNLDALSSKWEKYPNPGVGAILLPNTKYRWSICAITEPLPPGGKPENNMDKLKCAKEIDFTTKPKASEPPPPPPPPPPAPVIACNAQQVAGNIQGDIRTVNLGKKSGTFYILYETYTVADQITVTYENKQLWTSKCVSTGGDPFDPLNPPITYKSNKIKFSGKSTLATVTVKAGCNPNTQNQNTEWKYVVTCP